MTIHAVRCPSCGGTGDQTTTRVRETETARDVVTVTMPCADCLGRGVMWSDGVPFVICPQTKAPPPGGGTDPLPCGRSGTTCPGCGRTPSQIAAAHSSTRR